MSLCLPFLLLCGGIVQTNVSAEARLSVHGDCFVGRLSLVELYETAAFKVATFPIRQPSDFANLTAVLEKGFARFGVNVVRHLLAFKCGKPRAETFDSLMVRKPINVNNIAAY